MKIYKKQNPLPEDRGGLGAQDIKFVGGLEMLLVTTRNGAKAEMNCKSEQAGFDWEMIDFENSDLKCSHCPDSKLFNIHFPLFFCKMCRTYCRAIKTNVMA